MVHPPVAGRWAVVTRADLEADLRKRESQLSDTSDTLDVANGSTKLSALVQCRALRANEELLLMPGLNLKQKQAVGLEVERLERELAAFSESAGDLLQFESSNGSNSHISSSVLLTPEFASSASLASPRSPAAFFTSVLRYPKLIVTFPPPTRDPKAHDAKDNREIQVVRDVERDIYYIQGKTLKGSLGYNTILSHLSTRLLALARKIKWWGEPVDHQITQFSKLVLKAANRTESGGLSFDSISKLLNFNQTTAGGEVVVVPDSSILEPLRITLSAGPFRTHIPEDVISYNSSEGETVTRKRYAPASTSTWHTLGLRVHIEALTVYNLYTHADIETPLVKVAATFRSRMYLPLCPETGVSCTDFETLGYSSESNGVVELHIEEASDLDKRIEYNSGIQELQHEDLQLEVEDSEYATGRTHTAVRRVSDIRNFTASHDKEEYEYVEDTAPSRIGQLFDRIDSPSPPSGTTVGLFPRKISPVSPSRGGAGAVGHLFDRLQGNLS